MPNQPIDMERIVREVLRRLQDADPARSQTASAAPPAGGELLVPERVVALGQIEGRLSGVTEVVVPTGAVVTPSVRDELRRLGVSLRHCSQLGQRESRLDADSNAEGPWLLIDGELPAGLRSAASMVPPARRLATRDLRGGLQDLAAEAVSARVVVATRKGMLAAALANRQPTLRAAHIRTAEDLGAADRELGANVLVVDSLLAPLFRRTLEFARQQIQAAPAALLPREAQA